MSTRARIAMALPNGKFKSIYTHWDGYPKHHGGILREHYSTPDRVTALLALGDLSALRAEIGEKHDFEQRGHNMCTAYRRDRGDKGVAAKTSVNFTALVALALEWNAEYLYVFTGGRWQFVPVSWVTGRSIPTAEQLVEVTA